MSLSTAISPPSFPSLGNWRGSEHSGDNTPGELHWGYISFGSHGMDSCVVLQTLAYLVKPWSLLQWCEWLPEGPYQPTGPGVILALEHVFFGTQHHKPLWNREKTRFERFPSQKLVWGKILTVPKHVNSLEAENSVHRCFIKREILS